MAQLVAPGGSGCHDVFGRALPTERAETAVAWPHDRSLAAERLDRRTANLCRCEMIELRGKPADPASHQALVHEILVRVVDKWSMRVLSELVDHGPLRLTEQLQRVRGIRRDALRSMLKRVFWHWKVPFRARRE